MQVQHSKNDGPCNAQHPTISGAYCSDTSGDLHVHMDPVLQVRWSPAATEQDIINVTEIATWAERNHCRLGQCLYNILPGWAAMRVNGRLFDPFHREMREDEVTAWIDHHLVFGDDGRLLAVFDGNNILCERTGA